MKLKPILFFFVLTAIFSCKNNENQKVSYEDYKKRGDSLSQEAQQNLLKHLSKAIADSGVANAIQYCNINADKLTNAGAKKNSNFTIQRVTDKNRNPNNQLKTPQDKLVFEHFKTAKNDTVVYNNDEVIYYKPIRIMMPTCIKCHGTKEDIAPEVSKKIKQLYPKDLAINYKQGDLRGMWKIKFNK